MTLRPYVLVLKSRAGERRIPVGAASKREVSGNWKNYARPGETLARVEDDKG